MSIKQVDGTLERVATASGLPELVAQIERLTRAQTRSPVIQPAPRGKMGEFISYTPEATGPITIDRWLASPTWHDERLETPQELAAFIKMVDERDPRESAEVVFDRIAFVSATRVVFCYSREDRRDRATVQLLPSEPWAWLTTRAVSNAMSLKEFIRLLRITFAGCLPDNGRLVELYRNVTWKGTDVTNQTAGRGSEALGRDIKKQVDGIDNLPDEVTVTLPVFQNFNLNVKVRCAIEIDADTKTFELLPFPNQLRAGLETTLDQIRQIVKESGTPTFLGDVPSAINT